MSDLPAMKPIPGHEQYYAASEDGRIFSLNYRRTGRIAELAQSSLFDKRRPSESMYRRVKAYFINPNTPTAVHRLVAMAWIPNPMGLPQVNHIDGNKANNHVSNLEWVDNAENQRHSTRTGLHVHHRGEDHPMVKLTEAQAREIKAKVAAPYRGQLDDLASEYGVSKYCIFDIKRGKSWKEVA